MNVDWFPTTYELLPVLGMAFLWVFGASWAVLMVHERHPRINGWWLVLAWLLYPLTVAAILVDGYASWWRELDDL